MSTLSYIRFRTIIHELSSQPDGITFGELWRKIHPTKTMSMQTFSDTLQTLTQMGVLIKEPREPRRGESVTYRLSKDTNEFMFLAYRGVVELVRLLQSIKSVTVDDAFVKNLDNRAKLFGTFWLLQRYAEVCHKTLNSYVRDSMRLTCYIAKYPKARGFLEGVTRPYLEILLDLHSAMLRKLGIHNIDGYLEDAERGDLHFPAFPYQYSQVIRKFRHRLKAQPQPRELARLMQGIEKELNEFGRDVVRSVVELDDASHDPVKIYRELRKQVEELDATPTVNELFGIS